MDSHDHTDHTGGSKPTRPLSSGSTRGWQSTGSLVGVKMKQKCTIPWHTSTHLPWGGYMRAGMPFLISRGWRARIHRPGVPEGSTPWHAFVLALPTLFTLCICAAAASSSASFARRLTRCEHKHAARRRLLLRGNVFSIRRPAQCSSSQSARSLGSADDRHDPAMGVEWRKGPQNYHQRQWYGVHDV